MGKQVKHVFGMAKSCLDLKGAKSPKLELDFVRLLLAVKNCLAKDQDAVGYLLVMNERIAETVRSWKQKYGVEDEVLVEACSATDRELSRLTKEKQKNSTGISGKTASDSQANLGKNLGEKYLVKLIFQREVNVKRVEEKEKFPLNVNWDFYGVKN